MTLLGGTEHRPVGIQVLRGIGWFLGGVGVLMTAALLVQSVRGDDIGFSASPGRRAAGTAVIVVLLAGGCLTFRSLRHWARRPRWLVPVAALLAVAALVPALWATPPASSAADGCVPLLSAWQPVLAEPSAADQALYESSFDNLATADLHDKAAVAAAIAKDKAIRATPGGRLVSRFASWENSDAACAPVSRTHLGWSAVALGVGTAGIAAAVRRRRRA